MWVNHNLFKDIKLLTIMCNKEVHEIFIEESYVNCIFCNKQIQDPGKPRRYFCCDSMRLIKEDSIVCKNCGEVHDQYFSSEYIGFYENRYRIKRKSVYHRKYHIINVMTDIAQINGIQIGYYNRDNIPRIFKLIVMLHRKSIILAENSLLVYILSLNNYLTF